MHRLPDDDISESGETGVREFSSDALMDSGFPLPLPKRDAESYEYVLSRIERPRLVPAGLSVDASVRERYN
jgi:hypothetical protein